MKGVRYRYCTVPVFIILTTLNTKIKYLYQCCGAGAGGAEIILEPGAGAENKF